MYLCFFYLLFNNLLYNNFRCIYFKTKFEQILQQFENASQNSLKIFLLRIKLQTKISLPTKLCQRLPPLSRDKEPTSLFVWHTRSTRDTTLLCTWIAASFMLISRHWWTPDRTSDNLLRRTASRAHCITRPEENTDNNPPRSRRTVTSGGRHDCHEGHSHPERKYSCRVLSHDTV